MYTTNNNWKCFELTGTRSCTELPSYQVIHVHQCRLSAHRISWRGVNLHPSGFMRSNLILISTKSERSNEYFCSKCLKYEFRFYNIEEAKLDMFLFVFANTQWTNLLNYKKLVDYWKGSTVHTYIHAFIHTYIITYIHTHVHTYTHLYVHTYVYTYLHTYIHTYIHTRGADKFLARPTYRCRRTESVVSLGREVCSCAELQVFSCYRGWKEAC